MQAFVVSRKVNDSPGFIGFQFGEMSNTIVYANSQAEARQIGAEKMGVSDQLVDVEPMIYPTP